MVKLVPPWGSAMGRLAGWIFVLALVSASSCLAASKHAALKAPTPPLAIFQFKGVTAGEATDLSSMVDCMPGDTDGEVSCSPKDETIAGIGSRVTDNGQLSAPAVRMGFYKNKLTHVSIFFGGVYFSTIEDAFTQKYGKPCGIAHPQWQSQAGATFDNTEVTWCFSTGKLTLSARGLEVDKGLAEYEDTADEPKSSAPKVDF